jgi:hypothetical protein
LVSLVTSANYQGSGIGMGRNNAFTELCAEVAAPRDSWPPLKAGLFGGLHSRFTQIATSFENDLLKQLSWH